MQRLRDNHIAHSLKDAEWQRQMFHSTPPRTLLPSPYLSLSPQPMQLPAAIAPVTVVQPNRTLSNASSPTSPTASHSSTPSASTNPSSPPPPRRRRHTRGIGKIRRHRMTKEEEARFDPQDLVDLSGSTAAQSRKMTDEQRDIMLHKRRLRNRLSAARSRDKQRKTIADVGEEVDQLLEKTTQLQNKCTTVVSQLAELRNAHRQLMQENEQLKRTNEQLRNTVSDLKMANAKPPSNMRKTPSTLHLSLSTDMLDRLDKMISAPDGLLPTPPDSLCRIPSRLRLSLSTDKLHDASMPTLSASFPPLPRNLSIMDRLLDFASNSNINTDIIHNTMDNQALNNISKATQS